MSDLFHPAGSLVTSYLDDQVPLGLFRTVGVSYGSETLLIAERDDRRVGIVLAGHGAGNLRWLQSGPTSIAGVSLGPVAIEIGDQIEMAPPRQLDVILSSDGASLRAVHNGQFIDVKVADAAPAGGHHDGFVAKHWRLVRESGNQPATVLFERMPPEA